MFCSYFIEIRTLILEKRVVSTLNTKFRGGIIQQLVIQDTMTVIHVTHNYKMGARFYGPV